MKMGIFTANLLYDLTGLVIAITIITVTFFKWRFSYWSKKGLPTLNPRIPFGDLIVGKFTMGEQLQNIYSKFKAKGVPHGGIFMGPKPMYIPIDPELIKQMLVKDFQYFMNHGGYVNVQADPLTGNLFNLEDARWKDMRIKLTPTFTSGKMKMMFQTLVACSTGLKTLLDEAATNRVPIDIKDLLGRFTTDVIGSCAFGLECNSLKNPDSVFRKYGKKIFELNFVTRLKFLLTLCLPHTILKILNLKLMEKDVEQFFMETITKTVKYRETNNIYRKDFFHLLLQLKNRGAVVDDDKITDGTFTEKGLTMNELAAQAFVFFAAGFETSSTATTWTLYELALNPDVQEKLRNDINRVLYNYNGELTYDGIMEMTYLEKTLNESLRKYPPLPFLPRICTKDYKVPNTYVVVEKNISVFIPILGLHMDPDYYPNPEKFDPERFSEENKKSRHPFTWLPFGEGPRHCIGLRFGVLQSKVALVTLLQNYSISLNSKTKLPLKMDKKAVITTAEGGIWIDIKKLP